MKKQKIILFCLMSILYYIPNLFSKSSSSEPKENTSTKIVLETIAIADSISGLVLSCKNDKDPETIKAFIKNLIINLALITESVIKKRKESKSNRSMPLSEANSLDMYVEEIVDIILIKLQLKNQLL